MAKIPPRSWLKNTNQLWKYSLSVKLMVIAGIVVALRVFGVVGKEYDVPLAALVFLSLSMPLIFIKCPSCGKNPSFRIFTKSGAGSFVHKLIVMEACPYCKYDGGASQGIKKLGKTK